MSSPCSTADENFPNSGQSGEGRRRRRRGRRDILVVLLVVGMGTAAYLPSLRGGFVYDDHFLVEKNYSIRSLAPENIFRIVTHPINDTYRPFRALSYAVDYGLWGLNPIGFRLSNLALHLLNSVLVYCLVLVIVGCRWAAAFAALLFTLHPVQSEAVAWMSGRKDVLAASFILGSFLWYVAARKRRTGWAFSGSWLLFATAVLTKEAAVMMVGAVFAYELVMMGRDPGGRAGSIWSLAALRQPISKAAPYLVIGIAFVGMYLWVGRGHGMAASFHEGGAFATVVLMVKGFAYYVGLLFFPTRLCVDYNTFGSGELDVWFVLGAGVLGIVGVVSWCLIRMAPLAALGVFWFFLFLVPVSNVVPIAARIAERYLYIPFIGSALAAGVGVYGAWAVRGVAGRLLRGSLAVVLILMGVLTAYRAQDWTSDGRLWASALQSYPASPRINYSLGYFYHKRLAACPPEVRGRPAAGGVLARAGFHFAKALGSDPTYAKALVGLAHVALDRGDVARGLELLKHAATVQPADSLVRAAYGSVLARLGERGAALREYEAACSLAPNDYELLRDWGRVSLAAGHGRQALAAFRHVLSVSPTMPAIYSDIGNAHLDLGEFREAVAALERARIESPSDARIAHNLAYAYEELSKQQAKDTR